MEETATAIYINFTILQTPGQLGCSDHKGFEVIVSFFLYFRVLGELRT